MSRLVVNCRKTPFASTLGVAHMLLNLCEALAERHEVVFAVADPGDIDDTPARDVVRAVADVVTFDELASGDQADPSAIEICPHHFQERELCDRSIIICHDLHVFDVPWKYGERSASMQQSLRDNLTAADAVIVEFPRTYYAVERVAGIHLPDLFLTEAPLLLDTRGVAPRVGLAPAGTERPRLLYPAQLQDHKNHEGLVRGVAELAARGRDVQVWCPGSEFNEEITDRLRTFIADAGVENSFEFLGRVSDDELVRLYEACDAVIVPSLAEGGAYVPLEAIAAGRPVAVNDLESARLHIRSVHGEVVWFDASDPVGTADAIETLVDTDPADWYDANARCRERLGAIDWSLVADRWDHVIAMVEGLGPRPVLATDPDITDISYRVPALAAHR